MGVRLSQRVANELIAQSYLQEGDLIPRTRTDEAEGDGFMLQKRR
jgi:hypothetical protein